MSLSVTINNFSPTLATRAQELEKIDRLLKQASQNVRSAGGSATSGNLTDGGPQGTVVLGTWTYTPQASS
jgi:hypothetical protein